MYLRYLLVVLAYSNVCYCWFKQSLNSPNVEWTLVNENKTIVVSGTVPGGVYSDLQKNGVIDDILYGFNDVNTRWVAYDTWTYTTTFNVSLEEVQTRAAQIVFYGVDTVAFIELNDRPIGTTDNMFVRYVFDIKTYIQEGRNELKVVFASPIEAAKIRSGKHFTAPSCVPDEYHGECHANQLRKMQASFSWDWGPAFPSSGIWRKAYIEYFNGAIVRSVTSHVNKNGDHWEVKLKAHIETTQRKQQLSGHIQVAYTNDARENVTVGENVIADIQEDGTGEVEITVLISENVVSLWWPNGYGDQPLYGFKVTFRTTDYPDETSYKRINVGFRTVEVIEEDASSVLGNTTAGQGLTFYFKVNGHPLFMKGSNWIPANILPEFGGDMDTVDYLLESAQEAHMSMLRVWGGGVYESDYFYHKCDELGILVWQDFLFACSMYPADPEFLATVKTEIEQNVIRLQHHASIAVWAGNNENEVALRGNWYGTQSNFTQYKEQYIKLYVDTIKPIVETLDPERRYLVSSPSNGKESEKEGYIAQNPYDAHYGDTHYYDYLADNWNINIYPDTRFASEYGFQSLPSLATMRTSATDKKDFTVDSEYSKHRQHSPNGYLFIQTQMQKHLKLDELNLKNFDKFVYYSQISQAMAIKTETEFYRQSQESWYTMGALYWQLNDVWQAPSWSGIEYGGRWKMLHYYAKSFFAPVLVSPRHLLSGEVDVYLINDRLVPIVDAQIKVDVYNWSSLVPVNSTIYPANVYPLSSKKQIERLNILESYELEEVFLRFSLKAEGVQSSPYNFVFPVPLRTAVGLRKPRIEISVSRRTELADNGDIIRAVDITVDTVVMFLWLETTLEGRFENNGFIVTTPSVRVNFITKLQVKPGTVKSSISYQYYIN